MFEFAVLRLFFGSALLKKSSTARGLWRTWWLRAFAVSQKGVDPWDELDTIKDWLGNWNPERFDVEVLRLAQKRNFRIQEVSVMWRQGQQTRVRLFHDSLRMVHDLIDLRRVA